MIRIYKVLKPISGFKLGEHEVKCCAAGVPLDKAWRKALKYDPKKESIQRPKELKATAKVKKSEDKSK